MTRQAAADPNDSGNVPRLEWINVSEASNRVPALTDLSIAAPDGIQAGTMRMAQQNMKLFRPS